MGRTSDVETVERLIAAAPEPIFALLTDPRRHRDIDGSGKVRDPRHSPQRLTLGATFGMSMVSGVPYAMVNTVVDFAENRRIAWRTCGPPPFVRFLGGRIWRYELEPVDGGTLVRETWDLTGESAVTKPVFRLAGTSTRASMEATLARIETIVTA